MATTPKKVLITGSSGYVGQHLIASLGLGGVLDDNVKKTTCGANDDAGEAQKYELFCAYKSLTTFEDDLNQFLLETSSSLHPSIAGIYPIPNIDFSRPNSSIDLIEQACGVGEVDAIIHLAALSSPGYCEKNASVAWKVNCPSDILLLGAPIIFLSTDQVYEGTKQFYEEDADETLPVNIYGRTKLAFERVLLRSDSIADGPLLTEKELGGSSDSSSMPLQINLLPAPKQPSVILRSSLILGPPTPLKNGCNKGEYPSFLQFIESRLQSSTPTDYFVNEFRSVVHIDDVIRAIKHFLNNALLVSSADDDSLVTNKKTEVFNLGGNTRASRYDIALEVANHLKVDSFSANGVDRPSSDGGGGVPSPPDISMNVDKITKELGVSKMHGLKEIVASTFKQ